MLLKYGWKILIICSFVIFIVLLTSAKAYKLPPYYGLDIKIEGAVTESYHTNITYTKEDEKGVFITMLILGFGIQYEGKRRMVNFTGRINRQIHGQQGLRISSENLTLNFRNDFSKYDRINLTNILSHTQIPTSFEEEFGRIKGRFDFYRNSFNLSYNKDISKNFSITTSYINRLNWSPEEGITDSYQNNLNFGANYEFSVATAFSLLYSFTNSRFEDGGDITTQSISTGLRQNITKQLVISGNVGVITTPSATHTSVNTLLTQPVDIDRRTTINLSFSRGVQISSDRKDIFTNWRINGNFIRNLLKDLNSFISIFYGHGKFSSTGVTDRLLGASIMLNYVFWEHKSGKKLTGNFGYTFSNLDSTNENREYTRGTINLGLTAGF